VIKIGDEEMNKLALKGQRQVSAVVPIEVYESYKISGMKLAKIMEFGLKYGEAMIQARLLEQSLKNSEGIVARKVETIYKMGERIKELTERLIRYETVNDVEM
jgi:hypothetical protein